MPQDKIYSSASERRININGFTLLEVLVSISILAVIISTLCISFIGTVNNIEEVELRSDIYQMARIALGRICEDLESAYITPSTEDSEPVEDDLQTTGFQGEDSENQGRNSDTLRFTSRAHLVFDEDHEGAEKARISYYVKEKVDDDGFTLYRSDIPEFELDTEEEGGLLLCDNLYSINFTYHDKDGDAHDTWDSTSESFRDRLPARVSVLLEFIDKYDHDSPLRFMTSVALPLSGYAYENDS